MVLEKAIRIPRFLCGWMFLFLAAAFCASTALALPPSGGLSLVQVKSVVLDPRTNQPIVVLEDKENGRILPIWIGPSEAQAILLQLEGVQPPRPMTHDLLRNVIRSLKADVVRVVITELKAGTFFAYIDMKSLDRDFAIDSRPSDAIALALRAHVPIFVKSKVLREEVAGISIPRLTHRRRLGIVLQKMNPSLARFFGGGVVKGLLVSQVAKDSPGEHSGLRRGDVIMKVEGESVRTVQMFEKVYPKFPGGFDVTVRRGEKGAEIHVRLVPEKDGDDLSEK